MAVYLMSAIELCGAIFGWNLNKTPDEQDEPAAHEEQLDSGDYSAVKLMWDNELNESEEEDEVVVKPVVKRRKYGPSVHQSRTARVLSNLWQKVKKLPHYFDYNTFKKSFNRKHSKTEDSIRRTIFVQRCMDIFKSRVAYRAGAKDHLVTVNQFTDRSDEEIAAMFAPAPPAEFVAPSDAPKYEAQIRRHRTLLSLLEEGDYLPEMVSKSSAVGDQEGTLIDETDAKRLLEEHYSSPNSEPIIDLFGGDLESAVREELENLDVEMPSQAAIVDSPKKWSRRLPQPGVRKSSEDSYQVPDEDPKGDMLGEPYRAPQISDHDWLDWSEHMCFHTVYNQDEQCGKCYVIVATALAEFYKCIDKVITPRGKTGIMIRKFSQFYVQHCARDMNPYAFGCEGGSPLNLLRFIARRGIYNIKDWKELKKRAKNDPEVTNKNCPLKEFDFWDNIKVQMNPKLVPPSQWIQALMDGPLLVTVRVPIEGYVSYDKGVHDADGCERSELFHVMILVGYGTEEGKRYWRFRNSFGPKWGDKGHYKMSMSVPSKCVVGAVRIYHEQLDT